VGADSHGLKEALANQNRWRKDMNKFMAGVKRFVREEEGTEIVEWALVAGLLVAVGAAVFVTLGAEVSLLLGRIVTLLKTAG